MPSDYNLTRYKTVKVWLGEPTGRQGLSRLKALGVSWSLRSLPDEIVDKLGAQPLAPPLPPLGTFRDRAAFLAGVCWCLSWTSKLARNMETQAHE